MSRWSLMAKCSLPTAPQPHHAPLTSNRRHHRRTHNPTERAESGRKPYPRRTVQRTCTLHRSRHHETNHFTKTKRLPNPRHPAPQHWCLRIRQTPTPPSSEWHHQDLCAFPNEAYLLARRKESVGRAPCVIYTRIAKEFSVELTGSDADFSDSPEGSDIVLAIDVHLIDRVDDPGQLLEIVDLLIHVGLPLLVPRRRAF